ncbi:hypothetical protein Hte_012414 [Hypoxylon texense]
MRDLIESGTVRAKPFEAHTRKPHPTGERAQGLKRLIRLKELRENGEKKPPKIDLDRQLKMSALTAFVTITQTNTESRKQCSNKKSRGPCVECIAGGDDLFKGAYTNCQFSSTASACSFYKGKKRLPVNKRARARSSVLIY